MFYYLSSFSNTAIVYLENSATFAGKNIYIEVSFLIRLQASSLTLYQKRLRRRCFPDTFAKILGTPF